MDAETETEDDTMDPSQQNSAQQEAQPKQEKQPKVVTKQQMAASLQRFVQATGEAAAALDTRKKNMMLPIAFGACRAVSGNVLLRLQRREALNDASACLYRDTLAKLAHIASDERATGRIHAKTLTQVIDRVEAALRLADEVDGTPTALFGAEVQSAQSKLRKYAENHAEDSLMKMHKYVESMQQQKRGLSGDPVEGPMKTLISDLHLEMNMYMLNQKIGLPPRSDVHWVAFMEIAEALGDWIGRTAMTATPPKTLKPMFRVAQNFTKEFPRRLPPILLKNAGMRLRFNRQQERAEKKTKDKKSK